MLKPPSFAKPKCNSPAYSKFQHEVPWLKSLECKGENNYNRNNISQVWTNQNLRAHQSSRPLVMIFTFLLASNSLIDDGRNEKGRKCRNRLENFEE
jgi:hypothetical protein